MFDYTGSCMAAQRNARSDIVSVWPFVVMLACCVETSDTTRVRATPCRWMFVTTTTQYPFNLARRTTSGASRAPE